MTTAAVSQDVSKHPECGSFHMMVACLRLLENCCLWLSGLPEKLSFQHLRAPPFQQQIMLHALPHLYATFKVLYNLESKLKISFSTDVGSQ